MVRPLVHLALALSLGPFRACGGDPPAEGPVPLGEAESCRFDADCPPAGCEDVRCLGGTCVSTGVVADRDGDTFGAGAMCGGDCDDFDPGVRPGAFETCDLRDEDCDGRVDEGADARIVVVSIPVMDDRAVIAGWDGGPRRFLVVHATTGALFGTTVDLLGRQGPPAELFRLSRGSRFSAIHAVQRDDGDVLVVGRTDIGALEWAVFHADAEGRPELVTGPDFLDLEAQITASDVVYAGDQWRIGLDVQVVDTGELRRQVYDDLSLPPIFDEALPVEESWLAVADAASGFVVTSGESVVFGDGTRLPVGERVNAGGLARLGDTNLGLFTAAMVARGEAIRFHPGGVLGSVSIPRVPQPSSSAQLVDLGEGVTALVDADQVVFFGSSLNELAAIPAGPRLQRSAARSGESFAALAATSGLPAEITLFATCE